MERYGFVRGLIAAFLLFGSGLGAVFAQDATPAADQPGQYIYYPSEPAQPGGDLPGDPQVQLVKVTDGLAEPINVDSPRDGSGRVFVAERGGKIRIVQDGQLLDEPFLDISGDVEFQFLEEGLLGFTFHPDYANNGLFYVNYTNLLRSGDVVTVPFESHELTELEGRPVVVRLGQGLRRKEHRRCVFDGAHLDVVGLFIVLKILTCQKVHRLQQHAERVVLRARFGLSQFSPVTLWIRLTVVARAVVDTDNSIRRHQGHLQLGQVDQIELLHRLKNNLQHLFKPGLNILITVALKQGDQQHVQELGVGGAPHLLKEFVLAVRE